MDKQQALDLMKLEQLPAASQTPTAKCIALVERFSGIKDYVIASKIGIISDKGAKSAVKKIVEYYPVTKKVVAVEPEPEPESEEVPEIMPEPEPEQQETAELSEREKMIEYLVSKKMNKAKLNAKTDEELVKITEIYNQKEKGV